MAPSEVKPIWTPSEEDIKNSNLTAYTDYLRQTTNLSFNSYSDLYTWSVTKIADFWKSIWEYNDIIASQQPDSILNGNDIRTAEWFSSARFNFAENLLRHAHDDKDALIFQSENSTPVHISYRALAEQVASLADAFKTAGLKAGDRVAALITNRPEAIIGMLAAASIGAIWSSCSPDFGYQGVLDRFGQIRPKILIAVDSYNYNGKKFDLRDTLKQLEHSIPEIETLLLISEVDNQSAIGKQILWSDYLSKSPAPLTFTQLPFDHPLYIMYSSGTTGKPKCIVHGAGGTLLQHLKELVLHTNLKKTDTITYFTTCGWMMWNWLVTSLAVGATIYLYDGSPSFPSLTVLYDAIDENTISIFGTSPKFLSACESQKLSPVKSHSLTSLQTILSTGAPLSKQNFSYVYEHVKPDVQLASISGGTDIISCFMLGNPMLPVYTGELQCRGLGMKVETFDDNGMEITNQIGELVCTAPFPSRPIYFWDDEHGDKYKNAYFTHFNNVWRHGDYIKINEHGGCIVYGRSDATLNPGGIRIGTAEIYGPVEALEEVEDSIVVGKKESDDTKIILFVVLKPGLMLTKELIENIKNNLKTNRSPRHVPAEIYQVTDIPRTLNGKKVELAVTRIIHGQEISNLDAIGNPESLEQFSRFFQ